MKTRRLSAAAVLVGTLATAGLLAGAASASQGSEWNSAGGNPQNTRFQANEKTLSVSNVAGLEVKWEFTTGGDVSATPAVDGDTVYFPDRAGNLYAVDKRTGQQVGVQHPGASGVPGDNARATPAIADNKLIIGTQGALRRRGGKILAFHKDTGALLWSTTLDTHPAAVITQSATVSTEPRLRRDVLARGVVRRFRPRLSLLLVPRQHAGARPEHRRHRLADQNGAGRLPR